MGFCLGAYHAGKSALDLIPNGIDVNFEIEQDNAQADRDKDTTVQVDWNFNASTGDSRLEKGRWVYFQGGATMVGFKGSDPHVVARYFALLARMSLPQSRPMARGSSVWPARIQRHMSCSVSLPNEIIFTTL
jgi:hypothetical protein